MLNIFYFTKEHFYVLIETFMNMLLNIFLTFI